MGPWEGGKIVPQRVPRYAIVDGLAVPDAELVRIHVKERLAAVKIAEKIGERPFFVRARLKKLGCYNKGVRPLREKLDPQRLVMLYKLGYSPSEIGGFLGVATDTVKRHLRRTGLALWNRTPVGYVRAKMESKILDAGALKRFAGRKRKGGLFEW